MRLLAILCLATGAALAGSCQTVHSADDYQADAVASLPELRFYKIADT